MTTEEPIIDGWRYIDKFDKEAVAVYMLLQSLEYYVFFIIYFCILHPML
jgi:hypothetical protein